jgi:uncharacterized SAM-binding protein YcdF (DUF218 family)
VTATDREWRGHRRRIRWAVAGLCAVLAVATAAVAIYCFPPQDAPGEADLVYVIGPPQPARVALAERLRSEGVAPAILLSVFEDGDFSAASIPACREAYVTCEVAHPPTTKGEASLLTEFARTHPAERVVVVTTTVHVARTRYVFDRCFAGRTTVLAAESETTLRSWAWQMTYQTAAFAKAWLTPCALLDD